MQLRRFIMANINLTDLEIANLANTPIMTNKPGTVTFATLASSVNGIGPVRAMQFRGGLRQLQTGNDPSLSILADTVLAVLDGPGFQPEDPTVAQIATQLVSLGVIDNNEVNSVLYTISFPTDRNDVTENEVADIRAMINREAIAESLRSRIDSIRARFLNDSLNPAISNPSINLPTYNDYIAAVNGG